MASAPGEERVEWVDEHDRVIEIVTRKRMRTENLRHRSVGVVVLSSDGRLLVHRRADTKDLRPGWWDVCAGGVVTAGESYHASARRELAEEIGIVDADLEFIGAGRWDDERSMEISHLFRTFHDGPFTFADGEVAEARFVTPAELAELGGRHRFLPSCAMVLSFVTGFDL